MFDRIDNCCGLFSIHAVNEPIDLTAFHQTDQPIPAGMNPNVSTQVPYVITKYNVIEFLQLFGIVRLGLEKLGCQNALLKSRISDSLRMSETYL